MRYVKLPSCQDTLSLKIGNIIVALYNTLKKNTIYVVFCQKFVLFF